MKVSEQHRTSKVSRGALHCETKFGLPEEELEGLIQAAEDLPNVQIVGLMGMATFTDNQDQITSEFNKLKDLFDNEYIPDLNDSPDKMLLKCIDESNVALYNEK